MYIMYINYCLCSKLTPMSNVIGMAFVKSDKNGSPLYVKPCTMIQLCFPQFRHAAPNPRFKRRIVVALN